MGIKLSDHIDPENVKFNDLTMFWDLAMLEVMKTHPPKIALQLLRSVFLLE